MTRNWRSVGLASGALLATMSELRLPGLPLGPGELLLAALIAWLAIEAFRTRRLHTMPPVARVMTAFWAFSLLMLAIGAWIGYRHGVIRPALLAHDSLAYLFVSGCSLVLAWRVRSAQTAEAGLQWLTYCMIGAATFMWGYSLLELRLFGVELWYGGVGVRFKGLSINPNQTALMLILAPFLVMYSLAGLLSRKSNPIYVVSLVVIGAVAMAAGWETDSGALQLAWIVCIPVMAVAILLGRFRSSGGQARTELLLLASMLVLALLLVVAAQALYPSERGGGSQAGTTLLQANDVPARVALWVHGWEALMTSPWFGLGPGSFSGLAEPFQGSEAHNSLLDWGTNTGTVGVVLLMMLGLWLGWRLLRAGEMALFAGLLALVAFGFGHHVLRHPLLWAWLVLAAQVVAPKTKGTSGTACAV